MARIGTRALLTSLFLLVLVSVWALPRLIYAKPDALSLANGASLRWVDCWFKVNRTQPVWCGYLRTAPDPGHAGPPFELAVVYLPVPRWRESGPPVLYIPGGPGGANWLDADGVEGWRLFQDQLGLDQSLVLYDQRGVGQSKPVLQCPELLEARRELLPKLISTELVYRRLFDAGRTCYQRLRSEGHDLARLTTRANARDVRDLMHALGYARWDLYGVSYGTRVALELMRLQPGAVRAAVLDSVYPPDVHQERLMPWLLSRALRLSTRICEKGAHCRASPKLVAQQLDQALARIHRRGIRVQVPSPEQPGLQQQAAFMDADLAWALFDALYLADLIPQIPEALNAAAEGRLNDPLRAIYANTVSVLLDPTLSYAVSSSVDCHDGGLLAEADWNAVRNRYPRVVPLMRLDWRYGFCRFWDTGDAGPGFRQPVHSDTPTLLLSGEFDPVTPPRWAQRAARTLPNSRIVEFPAIGHGVLGAHACGPELVRAFLANPTRPSVPPCLDKLYETPPG